MARVRREVLRIERLGDYAGGLRVGSFSSLEAANKLVSSALADNKDIVGRVARGVSSLETIKKDFGSPTGYEAYAPTERSQPYIRDTTGVAVVIVRDQRSAKGYRVQTAYPINR